MLHIYVVKFEVDRLGISESNTEAGFIRSPEDHMNATKVRAVCFRSICIAS